ncbi:Toxin A [uncultured Clostridium sp.]|nr:Toxin A [uncultured Clostridium sp.]
MKKRKIGLLALLICLLLSLPVSAAVAKKDGWHKASNGVVYYYKNGKIAKGFVKIKNKTCYFNKKGKLVKNAWVIYKGKKYRADRCGTIKKNCFVKVDGKFYSLKADGSVRKGWQKFSYGISYFGKDGAIRKGLTVINGRTYLFSQKGILLTGTQTVGKTTYYLSDRGRLEMKKVSTGNGTLYYDGNGKKLSDVKVQDIETLERAKKIAAEITNSGMSQSQKLKACFDWVIKKPYVMRRKFVNEPGWPALYANDHFLLGGGNCESDAAAFAYLAKAIGYTDIHVCTDSDGTYGLAHSWAEINGLVYDPLFAEAKDYNKYYGAPYGVYELHPILRVAL